MKISWQEGNENYRPEHGRINEVDKNVQTRILLVEKGSVISEHMFTECLLNSLTVVICIYGALQIIPARLLRLCQTENLTQRIKGNNEDLPSYCELNRK